MKKNPVRNSEYTEFSDPRLSHSADRVAPDIPNLSADKGSPAAASPNDRMEINGRRKNKKRRKKTWFDYVLILLIIGLLGSGIYLLAKPYYVKHQRERVTDELLQMLDEGKEGQKLEYNPRAGRLQDPSYDVFDLTEDGRYQRRHQEVEAPKDAPEVAYLTPIGRLRVPSINLNTPLIAECDFDAMFYAASHWEESVRPDEKGCGVVLLHNSIYSHYDFTKAESLKVGDRVEITYGGQNYRYTIDAVDTIEPEDLMDRLDARMEDKEHQSVLLVTCTPFNVLTHRLLIHATLDSVGT